jgi:hypothetical protein
MYGQPAGRPYNSSFAAFRAVRVPTIPLPSKCGPYRSASASSNW